MAIRLLHTADWQLGKAFGSFGNEAGAQLRAQRLKTVRAVADLGRERGVDAILVAGDVFEQQRVSDETLTGALGALGRFPGPWVLLPGNHDFAEEGSVWHRMRGRRGTANIHFATEAEPLFLCHGSLAILPAPLHRRHEQRDLTEPWAAWQTAAGVFRVGLAHGSVTGVLQNEAEKHNPIAAGRAAEARLDYLALGDWHGSRQIDERTWYSGTPEPDGFKDNEPGKVLFVELTSPGAAPLVEPCAIGHFEWRAGTYTLESHGDIEAMDREISGWLPLERQVARLELRGALSLQELGFLEERLTWWRGQTAVLDESRDGLMARMIGDDFAAVQPPGFVAQAVASLHCIAETGTPSERQAATDALEILYQRCREMAASA